jgi:hypothetical protein
MAMDLDPAEAPRTHSHVDHCPNTARIAFRVDESEADEPGAVRADEPGHLRVRLGVIEVERREHDGPPDPSHARPSQVDLERGVRVPRSGEAITEAGVAMTIDDHGSLPRYRRRRHIDGRRGS